jgi:hypothetical protein
VREGAAGVQVQGTRRLLGQKIVGLAFAALFGLVFGFVVQSLGFLVKAVDSFKRSDDSVVFTAYRDK